MGTVVVAVVREENEICVEIQPGLRQRFADAPYIPIQILDLGIVPGQLAPCPFLDPGHWRHIRPQLNLPRRVARHPLRRRHVGVVWGLHREHRKERLAAPRLARLGLPADVVDE